MATRDAQRVVEVLLDRHGRTYAEELGIRVQAGRDPAQEHKLLKRFKGIGDVGVDVFFREIQVTWEELRPFLDRRALEAARQLGLGGGSTRRSCVGH